MDTAGKVWLVPRVQERNALASPHQEGEGRWQMRISPRVGLWRAGGTGSTRDTASYQPSIPAITGMGCPVTTMTWMK